MIQESTLQADRRIMAAATPADQEALGQTSLEDDVALVHTLSGNEALAVSFRIALKRALQSLQT
jgi:hypothetical protein